MRPTTTIFLLAHLPSFLTLTIPSGTSILNTTQLVPNIKPAPNNLTLHPLPNPYDMPNTDLTFNFDPWPEDQEQLSRTDVIQLFLRIRDQFEAHIRDHGDGLIHQRYHFRLRTVEMVIDSFPFNTGLLMYSEALSVLLAMSWRMQDVDYRKILAIVRKTSTGEDLGTVEVEGREHNGAVAR